MKIFKLFNTPLFLISAVLVVFTNACNHDTDTPDGPNLIDRFGPFEVKSNLTINLDSVDFSQNQRVTFEAEFNKNVNWVVEIRGQESGAIKRIEGFSRIVDASNAVWRGGTTELPFFRAELCDISLTVPEVPDYLDTADVKVSGTKVYEGSLFFDFEGDAANHIDLGNFEFDFDLDSTGIRDFITPAQGEFFYSLLGTDNTLNNFFVGLAVLKPSIVGETYIPLPTTVPENLYFNCFLYSDGRPYTIAVIEFVFDSNDSGECEDGQDAKFTVEGDYPVDWDGWIQISHPMSDTGITQEELEKLVAMRLILISDANAQPTPPQSVFFGVDYITFTEGQPLSL
jgi:hypothetical protein